MTLVSPVYLDANILVGAVVREHRLYRSCVLLVGELLTSQARILISPVCFQESLWAMVRISYYELTRQPRGKYFSMELYHRWCDRIFNIHGARISAVSSMVRDWTSAGAHVELVPKQEPIWSRVMELTPAYMRQLRLAPADALHLALAQTHAKTFLTADSHFTTVAEGLPVPELAVVHLDE